MIEYVLVLVERNDTDVLLVLKDRPKWMVGRLNLPGGKVEEIDKIGSSDPKIYSLVTASRELSEETGYIATSLKYSGSILGNNCIIYVIKAEINLTVVTPRNPGETEFVDWYNWLVVKNDPKLMPNLNIVIPITMFDLKEWIIQDFSNDLENNMYRLVINFRTN